MTWVTSLLRGRGWICTALFSAGASWVRNLPSPGFHCWRLCTCPVRPLHHRSQHSAARSWVPSRQLKSLHLLICKPFYFVVAFFNWKWIKKWKALVEIHSPHWSQSPFQNRNLNPWFPCLNPSLQPSALPGKTQMPATHTKPLPDDPRSSTGFPHFLPRKHRAVCSSRQTHPLLAWNAPQCWPPSSQRTSSLLEVALTIKV